MKVALLTRAIHPLHGHGGLERHAAGLKRYLQRAGVDVRVFTTPPYHELSEPRDESYTFVPYRTIPWPRRPGFVVLDRVTNYPLWSYRAARELLRSFAPDVVQADAGAGFGYAALGAPAPLVLHPHGMEEFKTTPWKRLAYLPLRCAVRYAATRATRVIAPDASMKEEVVEHLGVTAENVAVVPNAIDLEEIDRSRARSGASSLPFSPPLSDGETVLLSVGRLEANKGFTDLVRALGAIREQMPERWRFVLVGEGPARGAIERLAASEGIQDHALLAGALSDEELSALYERATLFVHPTRYEGSSMVTLEAMAHEKPVIATRVGGIPDKVVDGISGLLVPPGDVEALGRAISAAISEPAMLAEWGVEGRRIAEEAFSWSKRIGEVIALYESLLQ